MNASIYIKFLNSKNARLYFCNLKIYIYLNIYLNNKYLSKNREKFDKYSDFRPKNVDKAYSVVKTYKQSSFCNTNLSEFQSQYKAVRSAIYFLVEYNIKKKNRKYFKIWLFFLILEEKLILRKLYFYLYCTKVNKLLRNLEYFFICLLKKWKIGIFQFQIKLYLRTRPVFLLFSTRCLNIYNYIFSYFKNRLKQRRSYYINFITIIIIISILIGLS